MTKLYTALAILGITLLPACASIGAVVDGTQEFTTGVIDSSVKGVSTVSRAVLSDVSSVVATTVTIADGTIDAVASEVDKQTDELQETETKKD